MANTIRLRLYLGFIFLQMVLICSAQSDKHIEKCAAFSYIDTNYTPTAIYDETAFDATVIKKLKAKFQDRFGKVSNQVVFTVGYQYDLQKLRTEHWDRIKDFQWEIPLYILNYAFIDSATNVCYCMHYNIGENLEVIRGYTPKLSNKMMNTPLISIAEAKTLALNSRIKRRIRKRANFNTAKLRFRSDTGMFEWEFWSGPDRIYVEAVKEGTVYTGRFGGIIDF